MSGSRSGMTEIYCEQYRTTRTIIAGKEIRRKHLSNCLVDHMYSSATGSNASHNNEAAEAEELYTGFLYKSPPSGQIKLTVFGFPKHKYQQFTCIISVCQVSLSIAEIVEASLLCAHKEKRRQS